MTRYATSSHRRDLLDGLLDALRSLKFAGCRTAYLDGSFVTAETRPGDFDVCWESGDADLDRLDAELRDFSDRRAAQKARYGGELFPAEWPAQVDGTTYLDYFQCDSKGRAKGIVAVNLTELP